MDRVYDLYYTEYIGDELSEELSICLFWHGTRAESHTSSLIPVNGYEENAAGSPDACPYPKHKNSEAVKLACNEAGLKLAQIYIRHEKLNVKSRSCIIAFIEGQYLNETDELLERLKNSVSWLDISDEKPYFYIFHYGQPVFSLTASDSCRRINEKMKELFTGYSRDEDVCIAASVQRGSKSLIINHTKKFSLRAS